MDINISYGRGLHAVHVPVGSTVADVKAAAVAGALAPYAADIGAFGLGASYGGTALANDAVVTQSQLYVVDPPAAPAAAAVAPVAAAAPTTTAATDAEPVTATAATGSAAGATAAAGPRGSRDGPGHCAKCGFSLFHYNGKKCRVTGEVHAWDGPDPPSFAEANK